MTKPISESAVYDPPTPRAGADIRAIPTHMPEQTPTTACKRVLVLSASAGAGHLRAAEAIERAVIMEGAAEEVRNVDTLAYTNRVFRHLYSKTYIEMVNKMPEVLGWLYDQLDKPWQHERRRLALDKLNT